MGHHRSIRTPRLPRRLPAAIAALLVVSCASLATGAPIALAPGDKAPATLVAKLGAKHSERIDWAAARFTVVNFWATWCAACKQEMPVLESLRVANETKGLAVRGILLDGATDDDAALKYARQLAVGYPLYRGSPEVSELWGGIGLLPTTFVVSAEGRVVRRYVGATAETVRRMQSEIGDLVKAGGTSSWTGEPSPASPDPRP